MVRRYIFILISVILVFPLSAQQWKLKRIEGVFGIGTTNVYSDLGGAPSATSLLFIKDITFRSTRPSVYLGLRYRLSPKTSLKVSFIYGYSKTEDFAGSRNEKRGFSCVTQLIELSGNYEYYFLPEQRRLRSAASFNRKGMVNDYSSFGAYVFAGLGGVIFRPQLEISAERPGDKYKNNMGFTGAIPVGVGFKYIISDKWIFGYEVGYRQSFSDFMDGFQSSSSKHWDGYWISTINFSYRIPTSRRGLPIFLDRQWKKAKF
jgi:OOP family OmpA-OmpF porin